jgi:hypothetical protein
LHVCLQTKYLYITIIGDMNRNYESRKFEADKIALLGLFVLALLVAFIVVSVKSTLVFSEPIELFHTGISVSMPVGNGWQSDERWQYQKNSYILSSSFVVSSDKPTARAYCRYQIAPETLPAEIWYEQKAAEVSGKIMEVNREQKGALNIDWVRIERPEFLLTIFLGAIELPNNRRLNIEVHQIKDDVDMAEDVFRQIIESLNFEDNQLLTNGIEIVTAFKNKGVGSFLDNQSQQTYFIIKNSRGRVIGFMIDALMNSEPDAPMNIQAAGHLYGRGLQEQATLFRSRDDLSEFVWQSETKSIIGISRTEIILDKAGIMTIGEAGRQSETRHRLSAAAIPDIFIEHLLKQIFESDIKQIIVDIIDADGKITPTLISIVENMDNISLDEEATYAMKLEFLDEPGFFELVYLNDQKQVTKATLQKDRRYTIEKTSREVVVREFPERADFILQRNKIPGYNVF